MSFDPTRVKAICFDIDGTLSDTDDQWSAAIEKRLDIFSALISDKERQRMARWLVMASETPMNAIYRSLDALSLDDTFANLYERMIQKRKHKPAKFFLMAQAKETLDQLGKQFSLSVVSARDELTTQAFIDEFSLVSFFKAIATSQTCSHTKPNPAPIFWAAEQMKVPPQSCVMVGDTTVDILAGRAAGAQTVGLLCGFGTERELKRAGADLILPELHDVINLFQ